MHFDLPEQMRNQLERAANRVKAARRPLAISHIDTDGITALAIVCRMFRRLKKSPLWRNIHQLNSETIRDVRKLVSEKRPDTVIFSDLGTGQMPLIIEALGKQESLESIIVLDHHLPQNNTEGYLQKHANSPIIEVNPCHHGISGSSDLSGAGTAFLLAYEVSGKNADLSELAVVGATGDLQRYYGKGFSGVNRQILETGVESGMVRLDRDLTFFGINTRPLPFLLEYATDPYIPGITGNRDASFEFFEALGIPMKVNERWRRWVDLNTQEKQVVIQHLMSLILQSYQDARKAQGIVGDVITLLNRPERSELRSAKEFSTLLNACGRNRRAKVGVKICLGNQEAYQEGRTLLREHRRNLATALRRIETHGFDEREGMYLVQDSEIQDTIISIVIGMAQSSRILPDDKPVIGVTTNTSEKSSLAKLSGRTCRRLVNRGINLKETFVHCGECLNTKYDALVVEAGGHPMAAGAFIQPNRLEEYLDLVSRNLSKKLV
ncbi:MAG: DHH family phosphoesterase [Promethearchaeati archaeon]